MYLSESLTGSTKCYVTAVWRHKPSSLTRSSYGAGKNKDTIQYNTNTTNFWSNPNDNKIGCTNNANCVFFMLAHLSHFRLDRTSALALCDHHKCMFHSAALSSQHTLISSGAIQVLRLLNTKLQATLTKTARPVNMNMGHRFMYLLIYFWTACTCDSHAPCVRMPSMQ